MQGFTTLDLATALGDAHREELITALRTRPGPSHGWRAALGRRLVRAGNRLLDQSERRAPSPRAMGV